MYRAYNGKNELCIQYSTFSFFFSFLRHKLELNSIAMEKYKPPQENQRKNMGDQEIMPIRGVIFQVTDKLLRVRPLTHQTESNSLRTSSF